MKYVPTQGRAGLIGLKSQIRGALAGLVLATSPVWALAAPIDADQSKLEATFTQFNVPVTGEFTEFSGEVQFDPDNPESTDAKLIVTTASYDLGDAMYNEEVAGDDWFHSEKYPQAVFQLTAVQVEGSSYQATGELTLRGTTKPVSFPVNVHQQGSSHVFTGEAEIKRLEFGIGQGDWSDTSLVNDEVQIKFKLVLPN